LSVGKHRQRIAAEAPVGEDVDRDEGKRAHVRTDNGVG
jgi:hypothetical protein